MPSDSRSRRTPSAPSGEPARRQLHLVLLDLPAQFVQNAPAPPALRDLFELQGNDHARKCAHHLVHPRIVFLKLQNADRRSHLHTAFNAVAMQGVLVIRVLVPTYRPRPLATRPETTGGSPSSPYPPGGWRPRRTGARADDSRPIEGPAMRWNVARCTSSSRTSSLGTENERYLLANTDGQSPPPRNTRSTFPLGPLPRQCHSRPYRSRRGQFRFTAEYRTLDASGKSEICVWSAWSDRRKIFTRSRLYERKSRAVCSRPRIDRYISLQSFAQRSRASNSTRKYTPFQSNSSSRSWNRRSTASGFSAT